LLRKADREDVYITLIVIDHNKLKKSSVLLMDKFGEKGFLGKKLN